MSILALILAISQPPLGATDHQRTASVPDTVLQQPSQEPGHRLLQLEKDHVTVTIETFSAEEIIWTFTTDLTQKGIQPILLEIHNRSDATYTFRKADGPGYLAASEAAQYVFSGPVTTAIQQTKWLAVTAPVDAMGWVMKSLLRARVEAFRKLTKHKPSENRDIRSDFIRMEIPDSTLKPSDDLMGYVFLRLPGPQSPISVELTNSQTHTPLVFVVSPK